MIAGFEEGEGQGTRVAWPVEAEKGKKHILPGAPGRKETGSALRLISAQWGASLLDF